MPQASIRFFGNDWRSDARLRLCSASARGVWIDIMTFMMEAKPFGSLLINGVQPTPEQIAALTVTPVKVVKAALAELERNGVFSVDPDGTIYSRRMRRDAQRAIEAKENGKKGGNPKLKGNAATGDKPADEGGGYGEGLTPQDKPQGYTPIPNPIPSSEAIASGAAAPTDIRSMVFGAVLSWWREVTGDDDKPARAFLAKQCRDFDNATVVLAAGNLQSRAPPLYEPRSALVAECQRIWGERDAKRASHNGAGQSGGHGTMFAGFAEAAARAKTG